MENISALNTTILLLSGYKGPPPKDRANKAPPIRQTVADKIISVITQSGRFLFRKEISDLAPSYGIVLNGTLKGSLSAAKNNPESPLTEYKWMGNISVYGLSSWMENGEIKEERMFIKNDKYERNT